MDNLRKQRQLVFAKRSSKLIFLDGNIPNGVYYNYKMKVTLNNGEDKVETVNYRGER